MSYGSTPPPPPPPGAGGYPPPGDPNQHPQQSGYPGAMPPVPMGYGMPPQRTGTNPLAIASLVSSILGLVCFGVLLGAVGAAMGFAAQKQITTSGGTQGGAGMAKAGMIIGIVAFVVSIVLILGGASGWFKLPSTR
jgi:hypothetical protein